MFVYLPYHIDMVSNNELKNTHKITTNSIYVISELPSFIGPPFCDNFPLTTTMSDPSGTTFGVDLLESSNVVDPQSVLEMDGSVLEMFTLSTTVVG